MLFDFKSGNLHLEDNSNCHLSARLQYKSCFETYQDAIQWYLAAGS
jgi:hypothetical protein